MTSSRRTQTLLTVDVGNTRLRAACWRHGELRQEWSVATDASPSAWGRRWRRTVQEALTVAGRSPLRVEIASVARRRCASVVRALSEMQVRSVHVVSHDDAWPFEVAVDSPGTVGVDRLANLAGVVAHGVHTAVVVDVGTAITVDVLEHGAFPGGLISPGLSLQALALHEHTAALPLVSTSEDPPEFGRDTQRAIQAGIVHTTLAGTASVARRLARRLGRDTPIYLTGGWAGRLHPALRSARWDPQLLFRGLHHRASWRR